MKYMFLLLFAALSPLAGISQTLQTVTDNGNSTTRNMWIAMSPIAGVTEQAANIGGKIKLLGANSEYTTGTDANQPTIYRSGINTGTYPFNNYDNLILQAGMQYRDIILVTGWTPTPRLVVNGAGNVGIGTSNPGAYKLAVKGTIGAQKVKVTQSGWADFVFEPDYSLPSLAELETFIHTNKHLPDMPTEEEVASEGLDLGEMNKKLLQKIEELTLYLIEENKKNKAQQEMIDALKAEMTQLKATIQ